MSCAFFIHECHMPICIILAWMLCVYSYCLHTQIVDTTTISMFK
jgi:hypothetical protein